MTTNHMRDLRGVLDQEKATIVALISMEKFTRPMQIEAVTAGFYTSELWNKKYPKIQLITIAELRDGRTIDMRPVSQVGAAFKKAPKAKGKKPDSEEFSFEGEGE